MSPFTDTDAVELIGLAAATLVSEDLACAGAGALVASGRVGFSAAVVACLLGIWGGDLALFGVGRWLGRGLVERAARRWLRDDRWEAAIRRAEHAGLPVLVAARVLPGSRLPIYVAAGALGFRFSRFALSLFLAAAAWTPLVVGVAAAAGATGDRLVPKAAAVWLASAAGVLLMAAGVRCLRRLGERG